MKATAVYVHTPFCPSKCGYCDFNSYALSGTIIDRTVSAICAEILNSPQKGVPSKTIFFGGGTPTLLGYERLNRILAAIRTSHPPTDDCEITTEANPGTVDHKLFCELLNGGFNRLSLGAQSFDTGDLIRLGRVHDAGQIGSAMDAARRAGFDNINLDLMFGLPGQSLAAWRHNLQLALSLEPEHLSLYCLTIEPNTRFYRYERRGLLDLPQDDVLVSMFDLGVEATLAAGFEIYEISNFSRRGRQCQHNLAYWKAEDYIAYGPGAVSCITESPGQRIRSTRMKHPDRYCEAIENGSELLCETERLDSTTEAFERIMLGIRLAEGIPLAAVTNFEQVPKLIEKGWIQNTDSQIRLTSSGRHFCSEVAVLLG